MTVESTPLRVLWLILLLVETNHYYQSTCTCLTTKLLRNPTRLKQKCLRFWLSLRMKHTLPDRLKDSWTKLEQVCCLFYGRTMVRSRYHIREGADKPLVRPGRKRATATKLGIYSTYSTRSSIHFLDSCSNFCKPLKKIQKIVRPTNSPRQQ